MTTLEFDENHGMANYNWAIFHLVKGKIAQLYILIDNLLYIII